jgi:hypothetical protein
VAAGDQTSTIQGIHRKANLRITGPYADKPDSVRKSAEKSRITVKIVRRNEFCGWSELSDTVDLTHVNKAIKSNTKVHRNPLRMRITGTALGGRHKVVIASLGARRIALLP